MLLRPDGDGVICIGQPAHAWVSGQLAARWDPKPSEEVCLAAEQHDAGMADWDAAPELNPETGLPQSFMEMAARHASAAVGHAPQRVLPQSRYAAVLVSMHGSALYRMRNLDRMTAEDAAAVDGYLADQRALQGASAMGFDPGRAAPQPAAAVDLGLPLARPLPAAGRAARSSGVPSPSTSRSPRWPPDGP